jgi:hypothetical protein
MWHDLHDLLWELPPESAAMRALRQLLDEDGPDALPAEGPQTLRQARNLFDQMRARKAGRAVPRYQPWDALEVGPAANDYRITTEMIGDQEVSF